MRTTIVASASTSLTLSASASSVPVGQPVTLTATPSASVPSGDYIDVWEQNSQDDEQWSCPGPTSSPCGGPWIGYPTAGTRCFISYIDNDRLGGNPPAGIVATSNTVCVTWTAATYSATLSASTTTPAQGQSVTLTAVATSSTSNPVPVNYYLDIFDQATGNAVAGCWEATPCSTTIPANPGSHSYYAKVDCPALWTEYQPCQLATSSTLTVTWPVASQSCTAPTVPPLSGSLEGVSFLLSIQAGVDQTMVCFRADGGAPAVVGGAFVIATPAPISPSLSPGTSALCSTTPGNSVPGRHPIASLAVGSDSVMLDAFSGNQQAWVCVSIIPPAGPPVDERIVLPATALLPSVTFTGDPDSLVR